MMSQHDDQRVLAVLAVFSPCGGIGHTQHAMGVLGLDALWSEEYAAITRRRAERTARCERAGTHATGGEKRCPVCGGLGHGWVALGADVAAQLRAAERVRTRLCGEAAGYLGEPPSEALTRACGFVPRKDRPILPRGVDPRWEAVFRGVCHSGPALAAAASLAGVLVPPDPPKLPAPVAENASGRRWTF